MAYISQDALASTFCVLPDELVVHISKHGFTEYRGTRAMLEAEGVIPADVQWPTGFDYAHWKVGQCSFWLHRNRPERAKGPRQRFINVDWWHLRWDPRPNESYIDREIRRRAQDLAKFAMAHTQQGIAAFGRQFERSIAAREDQHYQAFKALVPGMIPLRRKRGKQQENEIRGTA